MYAPPEGLFRRLQLLDDEMSGIRLKLTETKLGNPKYAMERRELTDRLDHIQNEKIGLLTTYVGWLGGNPVIGDFPREGDWMIQISHVGPSEAQTAHGRAMISGASIQVAGVPWMLFDHEVERLVRSIETLEGAERSPGRGNAMSVMQDDIRELLLVLGLGDHARPISPHEVMQKEVLPAVRAIVAIIDGYDALERIRR